MRIAVGVVVVCVGLGTAAAGEGPRPLVRYANAGLETLGDRVTGWKGERSLTRVAGRPKAWRVDTPSGPRLVARFDGKAGLWASMGEWGRVEGDRTIVAHVRSAGDGFLFDGSTSSGMFRAQMRDGVWEVGTQPEPLANRDKAGAPTLAVAKGWRTHVFVFRTQAREIEHLMYDGERVDAKTVPATPGPLGGLIVGANVATQHGFRGDVAEFAVFGKALTRDEAAALARAVRAEWGDASDASEQPKPPTIPSDPRVFRTVVRRQGDDGVHTYRIPGLAVTPRGTLLAVFDVRHKNSADLPGDIDVGLMRSTDDGQTWSPLQRIVDFDAKVPKSQGNGVGDPTILVDAKKNVVWVAALWSKGNRAWNGSGPGTTPDETGQFVLSRSADDGLTWSKPVSITPQVMKPGWRLCFQGPGAGIQTKDGALVFPAQFREAKGTPRSCFVYSVDHGETWKISPPAVPTALPTSESQIAELSDGSLLLSMRNEARQGKRVWAAWTGPLEGGSWGPHRLDVPDPTCMAGLLRHPSGKLLISHCDSSSRRERLSLRVSEDDGKNWSAATLLDPRPSAYSCLATLRDGRVGVLYETGHAGPVETLTFARFPLEFVTGKR